jgi:hypothetical protein
MARNDPPPPGAPDDAPGAGDAGRGDPAGPEAPEDALRRLQDRLDRASGAAERLIAEAAAESAARASSAFRRPPPAGWRAPASGDGQARGGDLDLLVQLLESLRDLIPTELQQRLAEAVKELLLAVRALINWYLERLDRQPDEPAEVQDIPINWD